ncbi:AbrB/MazE/SpoVT family DNA-binding domain-containing protein [Lacunimicrobium album]|jgi:putative addiction module antidote
MVRLVIEKIGNSQGVIIPADVMARLNVKVGDVLTIDESNQIVESLPTPSKRERIMKIVDQIMEEDDNLLRRLAQ